MSRDVLGDAADTRASSRPIRAATTSRIPAEQDVVASGIVMTDFRGIPDSLMQKKS